MYAKLKWGVAYVKACLLVEGFLVGWRGRVRGIIRGSDIGDPLEDFGADAG